MVLTFFLLMLFLVTSYGSNRILRHFESVTKVLACFKDNATDDDAKAVQTQLQQTGKISSIRYISQDEALKIFKQRYSKDNPEITEFVQKDFLPICLDIKTNTPEQLDNIAAILKTDDKVGTISFLKDEIKSLLTWTQGIRLFGLAITIYAMVTSVFTILIVIGMKIASKKDEIEILQLLGATKWYIRGPFLVEGILYGIVGSITAWLLGLVPFLYIQHPLITFFSGEDFTVFPSVPIFLAILLGVQVAIGIVVGLIGSFISLWRYL